MAEPNIEMILQMDGFNVKVLVSKFHVKSDTPKSYGKVVALMSREHGAYETGLVKVYKVKDGTYRASTYVDGCFYPQYAKLKFVDDTFDRILSARDEYAKVRSVTNKHGNALRKSIYAKYNLV